MTVGTDLIIHTYNSNPIVYSYVNLTERMTENIYLLVLVKLLSLQYIYIMNLTETQPGFKP